MVWRGVVGDEGLYWSVFDETTEQPKWSDQLTFTDRGSLGTPSLAAFQDQFFMAWRGIEGDENLYWATYDPTHPRGWTDQHQLSDRASTAGPALVSFQNKLYMIWKGVQGIDENDTRFFWATYDPNDPRGWTDQNVLERISSDQSTVVEIGSVHQPAIAAFQNTLFIAGVGLQFGLIPEGAPGTGNSDSLQPGENPDPNGPPLPQGPDPSLDNPPPAPAPKGIFYATFDGTLPNLPVILFNDRASEAHVAQAVYFDIPLSLRNLMESHSFDPTQGYQAFIGKVFPAGVNVRSVPMRALIGF